MVKQIKEKQMKEILFSKKSSLKKRISASILDKREQVSNILLMAFQSISSFLVSTYKRTPKQKKLTAKENFCEQTNKHSLAH